MMGQSQLEVQQELYNALGGLEKIQIRILTLLPGPTASAVNCHLGIAHFPSATKTHSIAEVGCERKMAAECGCPESLRFHLQSAYQA
jgi:hypothetical protein